MRGIGQGDRLRVLFALPGLHRVERGAEIAFESVAARMARLPGIEVTLIGSGRARPGDPYTFRHAGAVPRERFRRWPRGPVFRSEYVYEEFTFAPGLWRAYRRGEFDVTVTCAYPFTNWLLRAGRGRSRRPPHVFVTQNGDWPATARNREYRWFGCDGLICTNPEIDERQRARWRCELIPNGVDTSVFTPGPADRAAFGLPERTPIVLIVAALIPSKRAADGLRALAGVHGVFVAVAGDGPLRDEIERLGAELLPGRFRRLAVPRERMPGLYRAADVLLHMSRDEPFGNIYVEAMSSGVPIVAHDTPSTRWITSGVARLVDTNDADAARRAVRDALSAPTFERERARTIAVERFDWSVIAAAYAGFLRRIAEGAGAAAAAGSAATVNGAPGLEPMPDAACRMPLFRHLQGESSAKSGIGHAASGTGERGAGSSPDPRVGAVVIGRNEGDRLARCLGSVLSRVAAAVYVDSGSTDGSPERAAATGATVIRLTTGPFTAARGRQAGLEALGRSLPTLEYVQFIDGDCVLDPGWPAAAAAYLDANPRAAAVTGRRREVNTAGSFYSRLVDIDWDIPPGPVLYFGGDSLNRVAALRDVGGWDTALIAGEEPDLCFRLIDRGWSIHRLGVEMTRHDIAMHGFRPYWRRAVRSGHAYAEVGWARRRGVGRVWLRRAAGIVAYGMALPIAAIVAPFAVRFGWFVPILAALLYARLIAAMALSCTRRGVLTRLALAYAALNTIGKVAGAIGVARYVVGRTIGKRSAIIEYKGPMPEVRASPAAAEVPP